MEKDEKTSDDFTDHYGSVVKRNPGRKAWVEMEKLVQALEELITEIKNTDIYKEYKKQRDIIEQYPDLTEKIDEFRQRNFALQTSNSEEDMFDAIDRFEKEYEQFRENPLVNDFLDAELYFCRMMQDIHLKITEAMEFE